MQFGERIRELRKAAGLSQKALSVRLGIGDAYLSKIENHHLDFGDYPSEALIHKLAVELETDEEELMILAEKVPERVRKRFLERPDVFLRLTELGDKQMDLVMDAAEKIRKAKR